MRGTWREPAEVSWTHAVATQAATTVPEAVAPVSVRGHTCFTWSGRVVAVFPFVDGGPADREDPDQVADAGRLLACIHGALLAWPPASPLVTLEPSVIDDDVSHLPDREFGLVHGAARFGLRDNIRYAECRGVSMEDDYQRRQRHGFERLKTRLPEVPTA